MRFFSSDQLTLDHALPCTTGAGVDMQVRSCRYKHRFLLSSTTGVGADMQVPNATGGSSCLTGATYAYDALFRYGN